MLIQFSTANYLSFKDLVSFSMVAASHKELSKTNVFVQGEKLKLLKSAVFYGANASGKSNLFRAIKFMKQFVINSSKETQVKEKIGVNSFMLNSDTAGRPSFFEIIFIFNNIRYRYGFQVDKKQVHSEWLFYVPTKKEVKLFAREGQKFDIGSHFKEGKNLAEKTRVNALFLSVGAQFNGPISISILNWFNRFNVISGLDDQGYFDYTFKKLKDNNFKKDILRLLKIADLGIEDIQTQERKIDNINDSPANMPLEVKKMLESMDNIIERQVTTQHKCFDKENKFSTYINFNLISEESQGTKKFFALSGPIIDTLQKGKVLLVDELDARLHPLLTKYLIKLFNSKIENPLNAQLIFASHDTIFLDIKQFRRDQIWFLEKNKYGASDIYSLAEYKVRNDAALEKQYIAGKYGATPFIRQIDKVSRNTNDD